LYADIGRPCFCHQIVLPDQQRSESRRK
jgi:hypothetical protein